MRKTFLLAALICLFAPSGFGQTTTTETKAAAARAVLDRIVDEVQFNDTPLVQAFEQVRQKSGARLFVDWNSLHAANVYGTTPISLHLKKKKLSTILNLLLDIVSAEGEKLAFQIDDGIIVIHQGEGMPAPEAVAVYDIRKLLTGFDDRTQPERIDALVRMLTDVVAPESWRDNGGTIGSIHELQGQLVIEQSPENHAVIKKLLAKLGYHGDEGFANIPSSEGTAARLMTAVFDVRGLIIARTDGRTRQERVDAAVRLITDIVAPESWRDNGGTIGSIRELQGQLIVTQTPENLAVIKALLAKLMAGNGR